MGSIFARYSLLGLAIAPLQTLWLGIDHLQSLAAAGLAVVVFGITHMLVRRFRPVAAVPAQLQDMEDELQMTDILEEGLPVVAMDDGLEPAMLMRRLDELQAAVHQVFGDAFAASLAESQQASIWTKGSRTVQPMAMAA